MIFSCWLTRYIDAFISILTRQILHYVYTLQLTFYLFRSFIFLSFKTHKKSFLAIYYSFIAYAKCPTTYRRIERNIFFTHTNRNLLWIRNFYFQKSVFWLLYYFDVSFSFLLLRLSISFSYGMQTVECIFRFFFVVFKTWECVVDFELTIHNPQTNQPHKRVERRKTFF